MICLRYARVIKKEETLVLSKLDMFNKQLCIENSNTKTVIETSASSFNTDFSRTYLQFYKATTCSVWSF